MTYVPHPGPGFEAEYLDDDVVDVLALPLNRLRLAAALGKDPETFDGSVYSSGTEHEAACAYAADVLDRGPALRAVLRAGLLALGQEVRGPFGLRLRDDILALEARLRAAEPIDGSGE